MADTYKFPINGYEVTVCKKQDILDCIEANIIDKEIMSAIVEQCELDAVNFLKDGVWTGIPFIGNIRASKFKELEKSEEQRALIEDARNTLAHDQFIAFRTQLGINNGKQLKEERYKNYMTSMFVTKHKKTYNKFMRKYGHEVAKFVCSTLLEINTIDYECE